MSLTTYLGIRDAIESWSHRNDVASRLDDFIDLAESEMNRWLRIRDMEKRSTAQTNGRFLSLPPSFVEMRRLRIVSGSQYYEILSKTPESLYVSAESGIPKGYTINTQIEFDRVPDSTYTVEMEYYASPSAISATTTTNAVLTRFPSIYLFGALWALYQWALQEDKSDYFYNKFMNAVQSANRQDKKGRHGPAPAMYYQGPTP